MLISQYYILHVKLVFQWRPIGGGGCHVRKLIFDEDEMVELDTAQLDFDSGKEDYYLNLIHFCEESIEMIGNSSEEEYWILQMI